MLDFITAERLLIFFGGMLLGFVIQAVYEAIANRNSQTEFTDELGDKMAVIEELRNYVSRLERVPTKNKHKQHNNYKFKKVNSSKNEPVKTRKRKPKVD